MEFFASPKNTEVNLSFVEHAKLQRTQVFCSLHNVVAISYFEQTKPQLKTHGSRFKAAGTINRINRISKTRTIKMGCSNCVCKLFLYDALQCKFYKLLFRSIIRYSQGLFLSTISLGRISRSDSTFRRTSSTHAVTTACLFSSEACLIWKLMYSVKPEVESFFNLT